MSIASRPTVQKVVKAELAQNASKTINLYSDYAYAVWTAELLDIQVTVTTTGGYDFDIKVDDVTSGTTNKFKRENVKLQTYKMHKAVSIAKDEKYALKVTNKDATTADFYIVYTIALHE